MHASALPPATLGALAIRFVVLCLAVVMVMQATRWALHAFSGAFIPFSALSGLGPVFAASAIGALWYKREKALPPSGAAWKIALLCMGLNVLVEAAVLFPLSRWSGVQFGIMPPAGLAVAPWKAGVVFAALQLMNFLAMRFLFAAGAQQAQRRANR